MGKKEEEQGAKLIRCGMGIVLGGVLALALIAAYGPRRRAARIAP